MQYMVVAAALIFVACSNSKSTGPADAGVDTQSGSDAHNAEVPFQRSEVGAAPPYEQREGDPVLGRDILINDGYISCGIPWSAFERVLAPSLPAGLELPDRTGDNAPLPFMYTRFEKDGVDLVSTNCLSCHANVVNGEVIVGLGNDGDFTTDFVFLAGFGRELLVDEDEIREFDRWMARVSVTGPHTRTDTIGVNPADNLPGILIAHRDRETWEWSEEPLLPEPEPNIVPLSVPPLWNIGKKNALYYTGMGRGDHARFMMSAALLCTDSIEEARAIDEKFVHVRAYLAEIEAPPYPFSVEEASVERGEEVFVDNCSRCHGTYGESETYPNLIVALDDVQTDPVLAVGTFEGNYQDVNMWFNNGFFGEISLMAPAMGYVAPPLDGVWATAPYLHNASVPTLALLLDSTRRPLYWSRDYDNPRYDTDEVGIAYVIKSYGKDGTEDVGEKREIYDGTRRGYSTSGHTYGDALSDEDREALIEYLKTL